MSEQCPDYAAQGFGERFGGFSNAYEQWSQATVRGMETDASGGEMMAMDQLNIDLDYADYFGYPIGTPAHEIFEDLVRRHRQGDEKGPMAS